MLHSLSLTGCDTAADVVFALDASGSIGDENFRTMISFVTRLVEQLDIDNAQSVFSGTRIGLVTFANDYKLEFDLNEYTEKIDILNAINVYYTQGTTNTSAAIR